MSRRKAISIILIFTLVVGTVAIFTFLPKRYKVGERMAQTLVFWHDQEAFLFLSVATTGQSSNIVQDKLAATKYGFWAVLLGRGPGFFEENTTAYHLLPSGEIERFPFPARTANYGSWTLQDGNLQLTPPATGYNEHNGFRWDGQKFVSVPPAPKPQPQAESNSQLDPDDFSADDDEGPAFLGAATRRLFKDAGWHCKLLNGYEGKGAEATLPIQLATQAFNLTIRSFPLPTNHTAQFNLLSIGAKSLEISGGKPPQASQVLWSQNGWREIPKKEYEFRALQSGRATTAPVAIWGWLAILLSVMVWRFYGWAHLLFSFFTMKGRVLKNMATSHSFPPATPAQFPSLDTAALDRYTREFESMGFTRLLDFSLVSDAPIQHPSFCRLFAHTGNHCFGEVSQIFPRGKSPMPLKCSIQSCLQDGWSIGFSDRKPQAASSLMRRTKS